MKLRGFVSGRCLAGLVALLTVMSASSLHADEPAAKVSFNGQVVGVFFNDGDSFRITKGRNKGGKARLFGFNTLESHGAVHQWGDWTAKEMYHLAKMATINGRRGSWTCESDGKSDTYGRMLVFCEDLAIDQIRKGLAHAMSVNDDPAEPKLLAAQKEAIAAKRGIWAHGVPEYVITSIHSIEEDVDGHGTYNRLVSTADGHSVRWRHQNRYKECENVCNLVYPADESLLPTVLQKLKAEGASIIGGISDADLLSMLRTYQKIRLVDREIPEDRRDAANDLLQKYAEAGMFGTASPSNGSCMVHIPFERRYGGQRAECLKK